MSFGALAIILFLIPNFSISSIANADIGAIKHDRAKSVIIKYIVDIVL